MGTLVMKIFMLDELEDYITKSESYTNPKTMKVVEKTAFGSGFTLVAVTFPSTYMVQWSKDYKGDNADIMCEADFKKLKEQEHLSGRIGDITTSDRF